MRDYGLSESDVEQLWAGWADGQSFHSVARTLGKPQHHLRRYLAQTGGIRPRAPRPAPSHLRLVEREEISRGIAAGLSSRAIAAALRRPASTVSREIARHGGRSTYRAARAHELAAIKRRRPKTAKLARCPPLRAVVETKLGQRCSPDQIAGWLRLEFAGDQRCGSRTRQFTDRCSTPACAPPNAPCFANCAPGGRYAARASREARPGVAGSRT